MANEKANEQPPRIKVLLMYVEHDLLFGWIWCQAAISAPALIFECEYMKRSWLWWGTYLACQRESVMALSRLTDPSTDCISIQKLLNYAEQNPQELPFATKEEVRRQVTLDRKWLVDHEIIPSIRRLRDKVFAHTDIGHLTPETFGSFPLDMAEVEECLRGIHRVSDNLRMMFDQSSLLLDGIKEDLSEEISYERLLHRISQKQATEFLDASLPT
jgi:hypothetical protein